MSECVVNTVLRDLVHSAEPTRTQKQGAARSHNFLRRVLPTGNMAGRIVDSFLSGSYARHTAIWPLDDVDVIVVIAPATWPDRLLSSLPAPSRVLDTFARAIRKRYRDSSVFKQRRSIRLQLYSLDVDVVPAVPDSRDGVFLIPDAQNDGWIRTAPSQQAQAAEEVNRRAAGLLKPLVKLLKLWSATLPKAARLKSFAVETMVTRIARSCSPDSLQHGALLFFDYLCRFSSEEPMFRWADDCGMHFGWFRPRVPDLTTVKSNIIAGIDDERRTRFIAEGVRSRKLLAAALKARSDDASSAHVERAFRAQRALSS